MDTLDQLRELSNEDLRIVYFSCIKVFKERGIYSFVKKKIKDYVNKTTDAKNVINNDSTKLNRYPLNGKTSISCLIDMIHDDWKYLFNGNYDEERRYYVYYHSYPNKSNMAYRKDGEKIEFVGRPFYIGKGTGDRYLNFNRNRVHSKILKYLSDECHFSKNEICHIFMDGLTEIEALELESKLITFFGCKNELTKSCHFTGMAPQLVNTDYGMRPDWISEKMKTINHGKR